MARADDTQASSLAIALAPPLEATTLVEQALAQPLGDVVVVAHHGRLIGGLTRGELERAEAFGLAGWRLADLLVADLQQVAPGASAVRVREALHAGPTPFVLVRAPGAAPWGFIDRRRFVGSGSSAEGWRYLPGSSRSRVRAGLRRCISGFALETLTVLGRRAATEGGRACLVGGVVRDLLLGRPTRDLDVVVEGKLTTLLRGLGREQKTHSRFRTATRVLDEGSALDVAHARSESYAHPAALPDVKIATIEEDLARRDFTINTLALSLAPDRFGSVLDLFGAVGDIEQRRIGVLHGLSFIDDPTRGFRAMRLAARLEFEIERRTARSLEVALRQGVFGRVSSARLRREIEMLCQASEFPRSIRLCARHGLLRVMSNGLQLTARTRARLDRAATTLAWYDERQRSERFERWLVPLGLLLTEAGPAVSGEVLERLRPGRRAAGILGRCREAVPELIAVLTRRPRPSPSTVYAACRGLEVEILLCAIASAPRRGTREAIRRHLAGSARN